MSHEKIWVCPHCNFSQIQLGPGDPHALNNAPVRQFIEYICHHCGNRMTPPGGLFTEGGARNNAAPGAELSAAGKLLSITCANFAHTGTGTAIITLDADAEDDGSHNDGLVVNLTSGSGAHMTIPATAVVPAGSRTVSVTVTGVGAGTSLLTAAATGSVSKTVTATAT